MKMLLGKRLAQLCLNRTLNNITVADNLVSGVLVELDSESVLDVVEERSDDDVAQVLAKLLEDLRCVAVNHLQGNRRVNGELRAILGIDGECRVVDGLDEGRILIDLFCEWIVPYTTSDEAHIINALVRAIKVDEDTLRTSINTLAARSQAQSCKKQD